MLADGSVHIINHKKYTGTVQLEVSKKDEDIIDKLCNLVTYSTKRDRTRNTNFAQNYHAVSFKKYGLKEE